MENHCRLCLKDFEVETNGERESHNIYENMVNDRTLQQVLAECFQLKFPSTDVATKVCSACYKDMQQVWQIRQRVLACDGAIQNLIGTSEEENATNNESQESKASMQGEEQKNVPYDKSLYTVYINLPQKSPETSDSIEHNLSPTVSDVNPLLDPVTHILFSNTIEDVQPTEPVNVIAEEIATVKNPVGRPRLYAPKIKRGRYFCYICSTKLTNLSLFDDHLMEHSRIMELICPVCNETETTIRRLNTHMKQHDHQRQTFLCMQCGKTFTTLACLKRHELSIHEGKIVKSTGQFSCKYCGKTVKSLWFLQVHENTHTKTIRYQCKVCGKEFSNRGSLVRHELIHTNNMPYKCNTCDASFRQHNNLKLHMRSIHATKMIECSRCEKRFVSRTKLIQHSIRCHPEIAKTPLQCYFCPANFGKKLNMKAHMLEYHPEEQLPLVSCDVCDRQFLTQYDVNKHKKRH